MFACNYFGERIHSVESSIPYVGMLTNSKYQIFVWMMFMTLLGCQLSVWVKKIWIFTFWFFSDTPYCIVVKSQQKSKGELLAKSGKLIFQRRSFLEGKIQKNGKNFLKYFYCSKTFVRSYRSFIYLSMLYWACKNCKKWQK